MCVCVCVQVEPSEDEAGDDDDESADERSEREQEGMEQTLTEDGEEMGKKVTLQMLTQWVDKIEKVS